MLKLIEKENALALALTDRLHDPNLPNSLEFLNEQTIVSREVVSGWQEIEMLSFVIFAIPFKLLFMPLQIFDHQIFPR